MWASWFPRFEAKGGSMFSRPHARCCIPQVRRISAVYPSIAPRSINSEACLHQTSRTSSRVQSFHKPREPVASSPGPTLAGYISPFNLPVLSHARNSAEPLHLRETRRLDKDHMGACELPRMLSAEQLQFLRLSINLKATRGTCASRSRSSGPSFDIMLYDTGCCVPDWVSGGQWLVWH